MSDSLLLQHRTLFLYSASCWEQVYADTLLSPAVLVIPGVPKFCQGQVGRKGSVWWGCL